MVRDCGTKVIHPDKVMDIETLVRKFLPRNTIGGNYYPVFAALGAGTREAYVKDFKFERELSRIYAYFKVKDIPIKNIIAIDHNKEICSQWSKMGISTFNYRWGVYNRMIEIKKYIKSLGNGTPMLFLYANHFGRNKDVRHHQSWIDIFNPHIFAALYSPRVGFTLQKLKNEIMKYKGYSPCDLGILNKYHEDGIIPYRGLFMTVLKKNSVKCITGNSGQIYGRR